jgi:hypothetical protein
MRYLLLACALGASLAGCARQDVPLNFYEGEFVGPVVAKRGTPEAPNYEHWCGQPSRKWRHGRYREFVPCARSEGWVRREGF